MFLVVVECVDVSEGTCMVVGCEANPNPNLLLNKVIAPYPSPPATANMPKFWKIADEEDGLLLLDDDDENVR